MTTPCERIREFCRQHGLTGQELEQLLGVLGEAVLAERQRCRAVAAAWAEHPRAGEYLGSTVAAFVARDLCYPDTPTEGHGG